MTGRTDNRGYPFPQCITPLVKDRSDIGSLRDLAVSVNSDADAVDDRIEQFIERPDAARIAFTGTVTSTGAANGFSFTVPYSSVTYFNAPGTTDIGSNALRTEERGLYMFTSTIRCTNGGEQSICMRHVRNHKTFQEGRRFEGPSQPINGNEENMTCSDVLLCQPGDIIQTQVKVQGVAGTFTYEGRLTMIQILGLDL